MRIFAIILVCHLFLSRSSAARVSVSGVKKKWHPLTFTFTGPYTGEMFNPNPFLDYRLNVFFQHRLTRQYFKVPGYFAADGNAANSGATNGRKWRAHFTPHLAGSWTLFASFRTGTNISLTLDTTAGKASSFDGETLFFKVQDLSHKPKPYSGERDHRKKGMLRYVGERYLRFDNGEYFVKGGADSPENFLAYKGFDNTHARYKKRGLKDYSPHTKDWKAGDPTWKGGKGKGIIGALNYLAGTGANAFSFLTFNVKGDGRDVWPWVQPFSFFRYDVSKLDQWNFVFSHADRLGLFMHFKTQETENDQLLDGGTLGPTRKLYYRELVARFGHHHALNWNLGEENDIWTELNDQHQKHVKSFIKFFHELDVNKHPVVIHSYPHEVQKVYTPLLGTRAGLDGMSLQTKWDLVHGTTLKWVRKSADAGRKWVVCNDEQNSHLHGVIPDGPKSNRGGIRRKVLWGNLMAGGGGVEYYFGYSHAHNDLTANNWRSRHLAWQDVNHALRFFRRYIPFYKMEPAQHLALSSKNVYVFGYPGKSYVYYFIWGPKSFVRIPKGTYKVQWYDPRTGKMFQRGRTKIYGPKDWQIDVLSDLDWTMLLTSI